MHGADIVKLVDYIPIELSLFINCFLKMRPNNFITNEIKGLCRLQNSVFEPGKVRAFTKGREIGQKLKEQIMLRKELCKHMMLEINRSE